MKKNCFRNYSKALFMACVLIVGFSACNSDDDDQGGADRIAGLDEQYTLDRCKILSLEPRVDGFSGGSFVWTMSNTDLGIEDSIVGTSKDLQFIALAEGRYDLIFTAKKNDLIEKLTTSISVKKEASAYSAYITKVYDFLPAVGQFINELPKYEVGDTQETMRKKAEDAIKGENSSMISLGGFGGYVVFGFDHTIVNVKGKKDFRVKGNSFYADNLPLDKRAGNIEPGVIMVAYDKNKNGKPDEDEWYEIAGSAYDASVKNYEVTYYKPDPNKPAVKGDVSWQTDIEYLKWEDNEGHLAYKTKNSFHSQSYFPEWITANKLTFKGTLLPVRAEEKSPSNWVTYAFAWGYADNAPNTQNESAIDIDWAVDGKGNKVRLAGIDFVKVYTAGNLELGWLGENSTEVAGAEDLHLLNVSIETDK